MYAVEVKNLSKSFKGKLVLNNISMQLEDQKIHGFFGRNGSGKTMLFRSIAGLIKPTAGEIRIFGKLLGKDFSFPPEMGLIIENVGLWPQFTGFENLKLLAGIQNKITDQEISAAISRVGLDPSDSRIYKKYSLGMKQRLGLAQALMEKPRLLILDEPTNALDTDGIEMLRTILFEEKDRGATVLIASHSKEDINLLCDCRHRLEAGGYQPYPEAWL